MPPRRPPARPPPSRSLCSESSRTPFCSASSGAQIAVSLFLLALLADAALQLFAGFVLARLTDLGAPRGGFLHLRLALGRVLGLRAHLVAHAIAPFLALLAFAGLACLLVRGL